ncbi:MAG: aminopeptidase [Planctomycetota bacterium]
MRDPRLDKLADVLVRYSTQVRKGDLVTVLGEPAAMPAVEAIFESVLRAGGHPSFHSRPESLQEVKLRHGSDEQITHECPFERCRLERCDVMIVLIHPINTRFLGHMDPSKVAMAQASRRDLISMSLQRHARGESRYVLTEIPSQAAAQDAQMSLADYSDWVFAAGFLHLSDPVTAWLELREQQERARAYFQARSTLRFQAPSSDGSRGGHKHDGTDLTVDVSGRTWMNHSGGENFPDGEVETGPRGVDGVVNYTFPAIYKGKEVEGIRLKFKAGRVVEASATKNEDYLVKLLDQDEGARNCGEIALGTNYHLKGFTRNTFFDEKIGGTFHAAVGAGYPQSGNTNQSALHWDMVCDLRPGGAYPGSPGGTVHGDGELVQRDGRFLFSGWPGA